MSRTHVVLVLGLLAALAFGAGWLFTPRSPEEPDTPAPATDELDVAPAPDADGTLTEMRAALAREQVLAGDLAAERDKLAARLAGLEQTGQPAGPGASVAKDAPYRFDVAAEALDAIDWPKTAEAAASMTSLLARWGEETRNGKPMPPFVADIQRWNGPLVNVAISALNHGVPGTGVNGSFTHPSIVVNLIHTTLTQAGHPLSAAQEEQLGALGERYVQEDARRLAGYAETTFALRKTIDEAALKDRLFADVDRLVDDQQREVLHPAAIRGRLALDLFSSGVIWLTLAQPLPFKTREDLARTLTNQATRHFDLGAEHHDALEQAVSTWVAGFTDEYLGAELDPLDRQGRFRIERVVVAARRQLAFFERFADQLRPDDPLVARLRAETTFLIPMRTP
jgi:hypothetical protein